MVALAFSLFRARSSRVPTCSSYLFPSHTKVSSTFYLLILLIEGIEFNQRSKSYLYILNCIQSYKRDAVTSAKYFAQRKYGCIDDARFQVRSTKGAQFRAISDWRTILTRHNRAARLNTGLSFLQPRAFPPRYFFRPYLPPQTYPSTIVLTNTYPLYLKATRPEQPSDLDPGPVARRPLSGEKKGGEKGRKRPLSSVKQ